MTGLDYMAIGMLVFMAILGFILFLFLGSWPGRVATARHHPYLSAVTTGGWVSLIAGGVLWPLVLIWAYAGTPDAAVLADARKEPA